MEAWFQDTVSRFRWGIPNENGRQSAPAFSLCNYSGLTRIRRSDPDPGPGGEADSDAFMATSGNIIGRSRKSRSNDTMFHLLVAYKGWGEGGDTIPTARIYINADESPGSLVLTGGKLDVAKVSRLPALLATEISGDGPQTARVAYINQIVQNGRDTSFQYVTDTGIPGIDSADLEQFSTQLGIKYSLTHTHWEVCPGDLFRVLLMKQLRSTATQPPGATVFSTAGIQDQEDDLVSVMMPFGAEFTPVYKALQNAATAVGLRCLRADDIWKHHHVIQDIVDLIAKARVVICDCSRKNANVFYEIGIAHALGKEVILVTQSKDDIPFDLRHFRFVSYLHNGEGLKELASAVENRLKTLMS